MKTRLQLLYRGALWLGLLLLFSIGAVIQLTDNALAQTPTNPKVQILLPLYRYPEWWNPATYVWDDVAASNQTVPITAIINPNSGPGGGAPNEDFVRGMSDLRIGGVKMVGYISTNYGNRPINAVLADVDLYHTHFVQHGVSGIFFDEVAGSAATIAYYEQLYAYVKAKAGLTQVFLNPGTRIDEVYVNRPAGDVAILYDDIGNGWPAYQVDSYVANYPANRFGAVIFAAATELGAIQSYVDLAVARNIGYLYITNDTAPNPWDTLPVFWNDMLAYMQQLNTVTGICSTVTDIPIQECQALERLYNSTVGAAWTNKSGWLQSPTACSWYGVVCTNGRVTQLQLQNNGLSGSLPPQIAALTELQHLWLFGNRLGGALPVELGNLSKLLSLRLYANRLTGIIPPEFGNLTNLEVLDLGNNQLTGGIPATLGNLAKLNTLMLYQNQLTGAIPATLGNLSNLTVLGLGVNQLTGAIPAELGNLTNLTDLSLFQNQLSGAIPNLARLQGLRVLSLAGNQLTGVIPNTIGNLINLEIIRLDHNQLSGEIPATLGSLQKLTELTLAVNQLSGAIPATLGNLSSLTLLHLWHNQLTGAIPTELGNLANLQKLYLSENQLSGAIPPTLGNLTNLTLLYLVQNQLSGALPTTLGNLTNLQELRVEVNPLSGALPQELTALSRLTRFYFDGTNLCEPKAQVIQTWLNAIQDLRRTNLPCLTILSLDKRVTPTQVAPGATVSVQITLTVDVATTVTLTESLPTGLTYVAGSATGGLSYQPATRQLLLTTPVVPGAPQLFTYQATVDAASPPGSIFDMRTLATGVGAQAAEKSVTAVIPNQEISTLVLIYAVADNDLGDEAVRLLNNAEKAADLNPSIATAVMLDGPGPKDAYLYYIQPDQQKLTCPNYSNLTCDGRYTLGINLFEWREDTANAGSVRDFIVKAIEAHPNAKRVVLSLVGHGSGWSPHFLASQPKGLPDQPGGLLWDQNPNGALSTIELGKALQEAQTATGKTLALLYLDACSMAMTEVAYQLAGYANYLLASESLTWATFPYDEFLTAINDLMSDKAIGERWLQIAKETLQRHGGNYPFTLSLIDLRQIGAIAQYKNALVAALRNLLADPAAKAKLETAIGETQCFDSNYDGKIDLEDTYCDLLNFTRQLTKQFPERADLVQAAQQLQSVITTAVTSKGNQSGTPWGFINADHWRFENDQLGGLSFYLPLKPRRNEAERRFYTGSHLQWAADTNWDDFFREYWGPVEPPTTTSESHYRQPFKPLPLQTIAKLRPERQVIQPGESVAVYLEFVNVSNQAGIGSVKLRMEYPKANLEVVACANTPLVQCNKQEAGVIQLSLLSVNGIFEDLHAATITFKAVGSANVTSALNLSILDFYNADDDSVAALAIDTAITIGTSPAFSPGDVNCSAGRNLVDARAILRHIVGWLGTAQNCPVTKEVIHLPACDVNQDNRCTDVDALFVQQCDTGTANVLCPSAQVVQSQMIGVEANFMPNPQSAVYWGDAIQEANGEVRLPLLISGQPTLIGAATVEIQYDSNKVQLLNCTVRATELSLFCNATYGDLGNGLASARLSFVTDTGVAGEIRLADLQLRANGIPLTDVTKHIALKVITLANNQGNSLLTPTDGGNRVFLPVVAR